MKEFLLDEPLPASFFSFLSNFGQVEALPQLGEGFFRFEKPDWFSIKGFAGDTTVEVRFRKEVMDLTVDFAYSLFSTFHGEKTDISGLKQREQAVAGRVCRRLYGT
jgi:hypothetical protein